MTKLKLAPYLVATYAGFDGAGDVPAQLKGLVQKACARPPYPLSSSWLALEEDRRWVT